MFESICPKCGRPVSLGFTSCAHCNPIPPLLTPVQNDTDDKQVGEQPRATTVGVPITDDSPKWFSFQAATLKRAGLIMIITGAAPVLVFLALFLWWFIPLMPRGTAGLPPSVKTIGIIFGISFLAALPGLPLLGVGKALYRRAKRKSALSAQLLVDRDPRPPILYLRSFKDDPEMSKTLDATIFGSLFTHVTQEEQLAEAMNEIGPFVAIGKPGEKLPQLGAAREYVANSEWQSRISSLLPQARLVLLRAGDSEGFWWEAATVTEKLPPEKIVFLLPFNKRQYKRFCRRAELLFPRPLPAFVRSRQNAKGKRMAVLYFEQDWTPHLLKFQIPFFLGNLGTVCTPFAYWVGPTKPLVSVYKSSLQPAIGQLGLQWQTPPRSFRKFYLFYSLCLAFVLGRTLFGVATATLGIMHFKRGVQFQQQFNPSAAEKEYRTALSYVPTLAGAHANLGLVLAMTGRREEALKESEQGLQLAPNDAQIRKGNRVTKLLAGQIPSGREAVKEQESRLRETLRLKPDSAEARTDLGAILAMSGRTDEAIHECREAIRLNPRFARAHFALGQALITKRLPNEAIREFKTALGIDPKDAGAHWGQGNALVQIGRTPEALREFEKAMKLEPANPFFRSSFETAKARSKVGLVPKDRAPPH